MCTSRILSCFTKQNVKNALKSTAISLFSLANAAMYISGPQHRLEQILKWLIPLLAKEISDESNEKTSIGLSYTVTIFLALVLLKRNIASYAKISQDFAKVDLEKRDLEKGEKSSHLESKSDYDYKELIDQELQTLKLHQPQKKERCKNLGSYTAALYKGWAVSESWYTLAAKLPFGGSSVIALISTLGLFAPTVYTQVAFMSQEKGGKVGGEKTDRNLKRRHSI